MIIPFWSWNFSDTTHVRSHAKFQLFWAINTAFTRGGLTQMWSWDPLTIRVNPGEIEKEGGSTKFRVKHQGKYTIINNLPS